jgi:hypothetical protein
MKELTNSFLLLPQVHVEAVRVRERKVFRYIDNARWKAEIESGQETRQPG